MGKGIIGEQPGDPFTRLLAERQAAGAFEGLEEMAQLGTIRQQRTDVLQEATTAGMIMERTRHTQCQPGVIGE
ncbi:MAG: hypothetical protein WCQ21_36470 [Verrucomicrobiota bacterium]